MKFGPIRRVLGNRNVLKATCGFAAFTLVLHGAWLAAMVYAFDNGGAAEAGIVAVGVLVPGAILSPLVAVWVDRLAPNKALARGYLLQGLMLLAAGASVVAQTSSFLTYFLLALFVVAQMSSRPTMSSVLPRVVLDPAELAAANSATGAVETLGLVLGPAIAGLVLFAFGSVAMAFLVAAIAMMAAALVVLTIDVTASQDMRELDEPDNTSAASKVLSGIQLLAHRRRRETSLL